MLVNNSTKIIVFVWAGSRENVVLEFARDKSTRQAATESNGHLIFIFHARRALGNFLFHFSFKLAWIHSIDVDCKLKCGILVSAREWPSNPVPKCSERRPCMRRRLRMSSDSLVRMRGRFSGLFGSRPNSLRLLPSYILNLGTTVSLNEIYN